MATATFVPVETYLRSSYKPDAEYVDGEIEERSRLLQPISSAMVNVHNLYNLFAHCEHDHIGQARELQLTGVGSVPGRPREGYLRSAHAVS